MRRSTMCAQNQADKIQKDPFTGGPIELPEMGTPIVVDSTLFEGLEVTEDFESIGVKDPTWIDPSEK
jgi:hypothetical protein